MKKKHFRTLEDIWPIYRLRINEKEYTDSDNVFGRGKTKSYIKNTLLSLFKGFKNIFIIKRYKTWIFSSSSNLFKNNEQLFDNFNSYFLDNLNSAVLILRPHSKINSKKVWTKRYISESFLLILVMILFNFYRLIKKDVPFEKELNKKAIEINYKAYYYRFWAEFVLFSKLIKLCKIEKVYISCSYAYFGYIYACKKNKVKVIEIQHGLISENHKAYIYKTPQNSDLFPDSICVFGNYFKHILLNHSTLYEEQQIKVVGSNALHLYSQNNFEKDTLINELRKKYKKIILFSGQFTVDKKSLKLIHSIQKKTTNVCFLFLTRKKEEVKEYKEIFKDIIFYEGKNKFYDLVKQVDFHATVYSTTFLESLYMGVPNILFDIEDYPQKSYTQILEKKHPFILCTNNETEIIDFIKQAPDFSKEEIRRSVNDYFQSGFISALKKECV